MTTIKALAAAAALAIAAAGCAAETDSPATADSPPAGTQTTPTTDTPDTTEAAALTPNDAELLEELFLLLVRDLPSFIGETDAELLDLGYGICDVLDDGWTFTEVATEFAARFAGDLTEAQFGDAGYLMGAAIPAFCPEYEAQIP